LVEASAGFVAWLGASLVVLADGRRGLALGIALAAAGLSALASVDAGPGAAAVVAVGGLVAAGGRLRAGEPGWAIMPAGSTPRMVLCVATALVARWLALVITTGSGAGLRFAAVVCLVLAAARILWSSDGVVELTAVGVLALAVGVASAAAGSGDVNFWPYLAGGVVAAGTGWIPQRKSGGG
jgi:hypothetical protein